MNYKSLSLNCEIHLINGIEDKNFIIIIIMVNIILSLMIIL